MLAPLTTIAPVPGDVIEDYEILEKIGGNMGLVFKARHRRLHKVVALKLLPAEYITDEGRLARFEREMRAMGQLHHPNLVTAFDARVVGCWYLVAMEFIEGIDLNRVLDKGPLPATAACEIARQAALGLQHAHEHGLIHRDIKPSNLMLTREGAIKVIDMGLALIQEEPTKQVTQPGFILGTLSYCAPEQFGDPSHVDIRADIYSLGCTLYHLLTGKTPYPERRTLAEIMQAQLHEPFPSLLDSRQDVPLSLDTVLARMTAKKSDARFATPNELVQALAPFAGGSDLKQLMAAPHTPAPVMDRKPQPKPVPIPVTPLPVAAQSPSRSKGETPKPRRSPPVRRKAHWTRSPAVWGLVLLPVGAFLATTFWKGDPVVVLMDTTAKDGIYDEANKKVPGGNNAQELIKPEVLGDLMPAESLRPEPISYEWSRDNAIRAMRPDLVVVHRSSFFHPLNEKFGFGVRSQLTNEVDIKKWEGGYAAADERLKLFIGFVGTHVPDTQFLIYSRGTDTNWLYLEFRDKWINDIETRFPELRGRVKTMVIPGKNVGTFRDPETRRLIRSIVIEMLGLPKKRK